MHASLPPGAAQRPYLAHFDHQKNERKLLTFKDKHRGQRCVIIGNGPSLARTDLSLIRNTASFGLNKLYLHFPVMGWEPTYLVAINPLVIEQSQAVYADLSIPLFLGHEALRFLKPWDSATFLMSWNPEPCFIGDVTKNIWQGHTVTFCAMQLAFFMGFSKAILVGVDHSFRFQGEPNQMQTMDHDDPNHFHPDYFKGMQWHTPDLERSEMAYTLARQAFEADGRCIVDATVDGCLDIFPKARLEDLF